MDGVSTGLMLVGGTTNIDYGNIQYASNISGEAATRLREANDLIRRSMEALPSRIRSVSSNSGRSFSNSLSDLAVSTSNIGGKTDYVSDKLASMYKGFKSFEDDRVEITSEIEDKVFETMNAVYTGASMDDTGAIIVNAAETETFWTRLGDIFGGIVEFFGDIIKKTLATLANAFIAVVQGLVSFLESIVDAVVMLAAALVKGVVWLFTGTTDYEWLNNYEAWTTNFVAYDAAGQMANSIYAAAPMIKENSWIADTFIEDAIVGVGKWGGVVVAGAAITYFTAGAGTGPFVAALMSSTGATVAMGAVSGFGEYSQMGLQSGMTFEQSLGMGTLGAGLGAVEAYGITQSFKVLSSTVKPTSVVGKLLGSGSDDVAAGIARINSNHKGISLFLENMNTKGANQITNIIQSFGAKKTAQGASAIVLKEAGEKALKEAGEQGVKEAGEKVVREAAEQTAREALEKSAKEAGEKAVQEAAEQQVKEAGEKAVRESAEKAAREAAEKSVKEAGENAVQEAGEQGVKEAGEKAVRESAEKAAREAAEKSGKEISEEAVSEAGEKAVQEATEQQVKEAGEKSIRESAEAKAKEGIEQTVKDAGEKAVQEATEQQVKEAGEQAVRETAEKTVREAGEQGVKDAGEKAVKESSEQAIKEAGEKSIKETAEAGAKESAEKAAQDAAEKIGQKTAKSASNRAVKEAGEQAIREGAEKTAREAAETAAREAGEKAVQETAEQTIKETGERVVRETAEQTYKETVERAGIEFSQETAERLGRETVESTSEQTIKEIGERTIREGAEKASMDAAQEGIEQAGREAVEQATKKEIKVTGREAIQEAATAAAREGTEYTVKKSATAAVKDVLTGSTAKTAAGFVGASALTNVIDDRMAGIMENIGDANVKPNVDPITQPDVGTVLPDMLEPDVSDDTSSVTGGETVKDPNVMGDTENQNPQDTSGNNTPSGNSNNNYGTPSGSAPSGNVNNTVSTPETVTPEENEIVEEEIPENPTEDEIIEEEVPQTPGEVEFDNSSGWDRYQEEVVNKVGEMFDNDPDALREQLREYGYSDSEIDKLMTDKNLATNAVIKGEQNDHIDHLLDIRENYINNPDALREQLKEFGYTDSEIDIIMRDPDLVSEAYINAELKNDFGISEDTFDRVLEINRMYYEDPEELKKLLKSYGYSDSKIDILMKDREMLQEAILAHEDKIKFQDGLTDVNPGDSDVSVDPIPPSITQNEDGSVTYSQGTVVPESGTLQDLLEKHKNEVPNSGSNNTTNQPTDQNNQVLDGATSMSIDDLGNIVIQ